MGFPFRGPAPAANAEDQVGILGALLDWASTFNSALNPVQAIMAATKTVPGISRFATSAEAIAGTLDTVALTPAMEAAREASFNVTTFAALNALSAPTGTVAALNDAPLASANTYCYWSLWMRQNGKWHPITPLTCTGFGTEPADVVTAVNAQSNLVLHPGAVLTTGAGGALNGLTWLYDSFTSTFKLQPQSNMLLSAFYNGANIAASAGYTVIPFDSNEVDRFGMHSTTTNNQNFVLPWNGRYRMDLRASLTNNLSDEVRLTFYNVTRGGDFFRSQQGLVATMPMGNSHEITGIAGDTWRTAIYVGTANTLIGGTTPSSRPTLSVRYLGDF